MNPDEETSPDDMIMVKRSEWDRLQSQTIKVDGKQLTVTSTVYDSRNDIARLEQKVEYYKQRLSAERLRFLNYLSKPWWKKIFPRKYQEL